jgi:RNA-directed DNA polymerase
VKHAAGAVAGLVCQVCWTVRRVAGRDKEGRFTALLHHVSVSRLRWACWAISPEAAAGVEAVTVGWLRAGPGG